MTPADIARLRLHSHQIVSASHPTPGDVLRWLGAVQAQDFLGGLWALGLRMSAASESAVEQALTEGSILRTHILRPTWHFVAPEDIRWMLALTGPRVRQANATINREFGLDDALFARTNGLIEKALAGSKRLTRAEIGDALAQAGITVDNSRLARIIMEAEISGIVCSGGRRGKQFTYALLDECVPPGKTLEREAAVAELVLRYFTSHGPATIKDFVWWSGLTITDARAGIKAAGDTLVSETVEGQTYWMSAALSAPPEPAADPYFLPSFDEYLISYNDRTASLPLERQAAWTLGNGVFANTVVQDGQVVALWRRTLKKGAVAVNISVFGPLTAAEREAVETAAQRYGAFLGLKVAVTMVQVVA